MSSTLNRIEFLRDKAKEERAKLEKFEELKNPVCEWCERKIEKNETFYVCNIHHVIFCEECARNKDKKEVSYYKAPSCLLKNNFPIIQTGRENGLDCIYEKYKNA